MKIAYLSASALPSRAANSVHVMKMCQAFAKNGHEVILLAPKKRDTELGVDDLYEFYGVDACFRIEKLSWVPFKGRGYIYGFLAALRERSFEPDLVYGRFVPGCYFSCVLGLPVAYESHAPVEDSGRICSWMFSRLIRGKHLKGLVVISDALRGYYLEKYDISEGLITVAHDGADEPRTSERLRLTDSGRLQVGYLGHLFPGRGIELILKLAEMCPWADFHLVGGVESDIEYWKSKTKELHNIFFHGFIPPSQTDRYCQSFDVLLAPYQRSVSVYGGGGDTSQWMSPLKIFEYMAAGKAILCSDLPVLREVLTHEKTALLCDPENPEGWVRALKRLRDDVDLRKRLGKTARREFMAKYTWKTRAESILRGLLVSALSA